jgi:hypothetical protein
MRLNNNGAGIILVSALMSYGISRPYGIGRRASFAGARLAGISDISESLQEISDILKGIHSFIASLSSISIISNIIGLETILLFVSVVVLSTGFSALGVPKGKFSFLISLVTADSLWILWKVSIQAGFPGYFLPIIKSNLIVLSPFLIITILGAMFPLLWTRFKRVILSLIRKKLTMDKKRLLALYDEYQTQSGVLTRHVVSEILGTEGAEQITLSYELQKSVEDLKSTLAKFNIKKQ